MVSYGAAPLPRTSLTQKPTESSPRFLGRCAGARGLGVGAGGVVGVLVCGTHWCVTRRLCGAVAGGWETARRRRRLVSGRSPGAWRRFPRTGGGSWPLRRPGGHLAARGARSRQGSYRSSGTSVTAGQQASAWVDAFVQRLRELGWIEGRTVAIEYRWGKAAPSAMPRLRPSLSGSRSMSEAGTAPAAVSA
jgi:hypothetical protein